MLAMKEPQLNLNCGNATRWRNPPRGEGAGRGGGNPSAHNTVSQNAMQLIIIIIINSVEALSLEVFTKHKLQHLIILVSSTISSTTSLV